jgi:tetratricopeptide (TPR) repeat protein
LVVAIPLVLFLACYWTYYRPVQTAAGHLATDDMAVLSGQVSREAAVAAAVKADRWSIEAARRLAALHFTKWQEDESTLSLNAWQRADATVRRLAPRRHSICRESAERYAALYRRTRDRRDLDRALDLAAGAIALYPTLADHRLFYAELLLEGGRPDEARPALAAAIELDRAKAAAGHEDKMLSGERKEKLQTLATELAVPY